MKKLKIRSLLKFSAEESLFSLPIVQLCFWVPFIFSGISAFLILKSNPLAFDWTAEGFLFASRNFKFPITLMGVSLALIGLCGANHRSEQSKAQMALTTSQNIFANHFKHLEEFEKYMTSTHQKNKELLDENAVRYKKTNMGAFAEDLQLSPHLNPQDYRKFYRKIYPLSKHGDFYLDIPYTKYLDNFIFEMIDNFENIHVNVGSSRERQLVVIFDKLEKFRKENSIVAYRIYKPGIYDDVLVKEIHTDEGSDLILDFHSYVRAVDAALQFDTSYKSSEKIEWLLSVELEYLPKIPVREISTLPDETFNNLFPTSDAK